MASRHRGRQTNKRERLRANAMPHAETARAPARSWRAHGVCVPVARARGNSTKLGQGNVAQLGVHKYSAWE
eukprot:7889295-Lingulodinium_polyedra.AAC.1